MTERSDPGWAALFDLLRRTEPIADRYDVEWLGPYFIPRPGRWHRSRFMLYGGCLYSSLEVGTAEHKAEWLVGSNDVRYWGDIGFSSSWESERLWEKALPQLARRLAAALESTDAYNARVARLLPLAARAGRLLRKWTWPLGTRAPLSPAELTALEIARDRGARAEATGEISAEDYFRIVGAVYDAAFPESAGTPVLARHASMADTRHGGLKDLPPGDPERFAAWFDSREWAGAHPWEIVFGHPHGIVLSPLRDGDGAWRFLLSVDSPGMYLHAVRMAIALGDAGVPFSLFGSGVIVSALRGTDDVEVGPYYGMLPLERLREIRPDALGKVRWDAIPEIRPISDTQREKVRYVLERGSPAGWVDTSGD